MQKKKLPTGVVNYEKLIKGNYYLVDKTMIINDFLNRGSEVTLITRPRRFGKTSAMNMLSEFFDLTKDSKELFKNTNIMNTEYVKEMNQYPTIFISFASAKGNKMNVIKFIKLELLREFQRYKHIFKNLDEYDSPVFKKIKCGLDESDNNFLDDVNNSLKFLTKQLELYYHKKVMLFIDEYDTPFIEAHVSKFYNEIKSGLVSLLQGALKDNDSLKYAMLTGIQRVAKENIFSELNNIDVYTVRETDYAQYFGFTKEETKELLEYYDLEYNDQVKDMYDGYRIGGVEIYNPWSIINYAKSKKLRAYWVNTSSNKMIKEAMKDREPSFNEGFKKLIINRFLDTELNMETSFYEQSDTNSLWGLFVNAGYLTITEIIKAQDIDEEDSEVEKYRIRIPNREVISEFKALVAYFLHVDVSELTDLHKSIREKDSTLFIKNYEKLLLANPSYHDLTSENSYQMLLLGICLYIKNEYDIISNREEGKGRCDIIMKSKKKTLPSYVIELKYMKKEEYEKHPEQLKVLAQEAIDQIERNKYDCELSGEVIHVGLAHRGKDVEMIWKERDQ